MIPALCLLAYAIIGLVIGRTWHAVCTRRRFDDFTAMAGVVGFFWPFMSVIVPLAYLMAAFGFGVLVPVYKWSCVQIDRVVARVVPAL